MHLDGTHKQFNEYCSFQVTTDDGPQGLSMGFQDMPAGSADDYLTATKDLFAEIAKLISPKDSTSTCIEEKQGQLLKTFKNIQSDHHIVNKNYFEQLKIYRASFLPKVLPNFHQLSVDEVSKVVHMNQLFCRMHAIIGMANVCKEALKEFEHVAASELVTSGFNKGNARCFDILSPPPMHTKKVVSQIFGSLTCSMKDLRTTLFLSVVRRLMYCLFVIGAAAYYHREHILEFLEHDCIQTGKLLTAIKDIKENISGMFLGLQYDGKICNRSTDVSC